MVKIRLKSVLGRSQNWRLHLFHLTPLLDFHEYHRSFLRDTRPSRYSYSCSSFFIYLAIPIHMMPSTISVQFPGDPSAGLQQLLKHLRETRQIEVTNSSNESGTFFSRILALMLNYI